MPRPRPDQRPTRVLAVASGGGHWVQLRRLLPAFEGCELVFTTVDAAYRDDVEPARLHVVNDANKTTKWALALLAARMFGVVLRERPDIVVSTGAAPGLFGVIFGKFLRARTIWVDSLANVERMSLSGRLARRFADLWLTQWPHLATPNGPRYEGSVL